MLKSQIKFIDFGLATYLDDSNVAYTALGTPGYMDPIILKKFNNILKYKFNDKSICYNEKADIFSLGTVCYEMIIGRKIFDGKEVNEIEKKTEDGNYHLPTNLSEEVVSFLNGMLQYDEKMRLSADELSRHIFLTKNVIYFKKLNLHKISHKINNQGLNINNKKNQTIWGIFQENDGNILISIPGNIFNDKPLPEQDEYFQKHGSNNIVNNDTNNFKNNNMYNNYNVPNVYHNYNNNNIYGIRGVNANNNNNNIYDIEGVNASNNNIYDIGGVNASNNNIYSIRGVNANNYYLNMQKPKYYNVNLNENKNLNNKYNPQINPKQIPIQPQYIIMYQHPPNYQLLLNQHIKLTINLCTNTNNIHNIIILMPVNLNRKHIIN